MQSVRHVLISVYKKRSIVQTVFFYCAYINHLSFKNYSELWIQYVCKSSVNHIKPRNKPFKISLSISTLYLIYYICFSLLNKWCAKYHHPFYLCVLDLWVMWTCLTCRTKWMYSLPTYELFCNVVYAQPINFIHLSFKKKHYKSEEWTFWVVSEVCWCLCFCQRSFVKSPNSWQHQPAA